jgi:hypothetical protein
MLIKKPVCLNPKSQPSGSTQSDSDTGMNYFEQSIYAIEEFVQVRKRINEFKNDKYFLFKTSDIK